MDKTDKHIELYSDEVQEIIGRLPSWIVRWGIVTLGIVLLLILFGAAWFRYPDRITSQIVITSENPPIFIVAKTSGQLTDLLVKDKDTVQSGDLLGVIESSGDYQDIQAIHDSLSVFREIFRETDSLPSLVLASTNFGSVQSSFAVFQRTLADLQEFLLTNLHQAKVTGMKNQLRNHQVLYDRQYKSRRIVDRELTLQEKNSIRMHQLYDSLVLTDVELERAESEYLKAQLNSETARTLLSQTQIAIDEIKQNIELTEREYLNQKNALRNRVFEALELLQGDINEWKLNYLFISPITGIVSFTQVWSENQFLREGDRVINVVPYHPGEPVGKLQMPLKGSGKVKPNQTVLIMADNYPYMEYGMIKGTINQISLVSELNHYSVEVSLDSGMVSTYGQELPFNQGMTGTAEIITEEMSFLVRIINPLKSVFRRNREIN